MLKQLLLPALLATLAGTQLQAQSFTLRAAGGYAWAGFLKNEPITGPKVDPFTPYEDALVPMANINRPNTADSAYRYQPLRDSYGRGMNFTFAFGYNINPYFGVEMGVQYHKSATISCRQTYPLVFQPYPGAPFAGSDFTLQAHLRTNAFSVALMPAVIVQAAMPGWVVYPYARLGIVLPVYGGLTHTVDIDINEEAFDNAALANILGKAPYFLGKHTEVELKTEGTVSVGINGALGIAYKPKPFISIFAEATGQYLVTRAKETKITKWDADGVSKIEERGKYRTEFIYHDELTDASNNGTVNPPSADPAIPNYNPDKPKDDIRPIGPFSNLGINIGVTFYLSKQILKPQSKTPKAN